MTVTDLYAELPTAADTVHQWESAITFIDSGLYNAITAREELANVEMAIDLAEAHALLSSEGKNEAERRARMTIALSESVAYADLIDERRKTQERLRDSERIVCLNKERARLSRAVLALLSHEDATS